MSVTVKFLGAAGTVTGSKYLISASGKKILVDAGLFQGRREWRERNWHTPEFNLSEIDAVLLTHAHIDHTGILPRYVSLGLKCPVYCTKATQQLCGLLLPDSAYLQEEEAEYRQKKESRSRHHPPLPLYTKKDAEDSLKLMRAVSFEKEVEVVKGVRAKWNPMGHILGAASINLTVDSTTFTFSGDIGRYNVPILRDPHPVDFGDVLFIESTYGDRLHDTNSPQKELARVINEAEARGGMVLIPAFAVGRTQLILYYLRELKEQGKISNIPVIIDSPMATDATSVYRDNPGCYDKAALDIREDGGSPFLPEKVYFTRNRKESIELNSITDPMIIISASGMLSGGRVLHHLRHRISSPMNTILFVGYQPPGGRGDWILSGAKTLKIFGSDVEIRAKVEELSGLSAHGDRDEMLKWCEQSSGKPSQVMVVHGEPESAKAFSETLREKFSWKTKVPRYLEEVEI